MIRVLLFYQKESIKINNKKADDIRTGSSFVILESSISKKIDDIAVHVGLYPVIGQNFHLLPNISVSTFSLLLGAKLAVGVESELIANSYKQFSQVNPFIDLVDLQHLPEPLPA